MSTVIKAIGAIGLVAALCFSSANVTGPEPVFGIFRFDCWQRGEFLSNEDKCFQFAALKVLGLAIVMAAFLIKVPQLSKILESGSVAGLSRVGAYAELISFFNTMAYARHLGAGLSLYGETILISIQNFTVVLCIFHFDPKVRWLEKLLFLGGFGMYATVLLMDTNVSDQAWHTISGSVAVCSIVARGMQIFENCRNDSTGQLAGGNLAITQSISSGRLTSVLLESDDYMYRMQYIVGNFMVSLLTIQFCHLNYVRKPAPKTQQSKESPRRRQSASPSRRSRSPARGASSPTRRNTSPGKSSAQRGSSPSKRRGTSPVRRRRSPSPQHRTQ